jgi:hypothetical protein
VEEVDMIPVHDMAMLSKLMAVTTSDKDGEALNAVRMANRILAKYQTTWPEVLREAGPGPVPDPSLDPELDAAFSEVLSNLRPGSFATTMNGIHAQWKKDRWISPNQRRTVMNAMRNARRWRAERNGGGRGT